MSDFNKALDYALRNEGGFVNDPTDRGGVTNMGITMHMLTWWRNKAGLQTTVDDMKNLTRETAADIYRSSFWDPMKLDMVENDGIATAIFDCAVNLGIGKAAMIAQKSCASEKDGVMGRHTVALINACDPVDFMLKFTTELIAYYNGLASNNPTQNRFLNGWVARAHRMMELVG